VPAWEVDFYQRGDVHALTELAEDLTNRQFKHVRRQLLRLEEHGFDLDGDWFDHVASSGQRLQEFRMTADKTEVRFLFRLMGRRFLMLRGFVHKRATDVERHVPVAERRLVEWMERL